MNMHPRLVLGWSLALVFCGLLGQPAAAQEKAPKAQDAASQQAAASGPKSLLQMNLTANNVDPRTVNTIESFITVELDKNQNLKVLAGDDVKKMLDLESQKQAAGCDDDSSCLAEIAGALGADYVVTGQLGKLDTRLILTLNLFDAGKKEAINRVTVKADSLDQMPEQVESAVFRLIAPLSGNDASGAGVAVDGEGPGIMPWILVGSGTGILTVGLISAMVGGLNWMAIGGDREILAGLQTEAETSGLTPERRQDIVEVQNNLEEDVALWNTIGLPAFWGGVTLSAVGTGLLTWGIVMLTTQGGDHE
jgi:TolB-like protein